MRNFKALVKAQFLSFLGGLGSKNAKREKSAKKLAKLILPIFLIALIFGVSYLYTFIFSQTLALSGKNAQIVPLMLSMSVVVSLIFSFYSAVKVLFGFNDYDMIFSMPVKTSEVVLSKVLFSYLIDFIFSLLIVLPSLIFSGKFGVDVSALGIINIVIMLVGAPFFSICISALLGFIIALISYKAKRRALIETLLYLAVLVGYFILVFLTSSSTETAEDTLFLSIFEKTYFLYPLVVLGINSTKYALVVFGVQLVAVIIPLTLIATFYHKIHTLFTAKKATKVYKHKDLKKTSSIKALYKKEIKRLFSSSLYVVNCLLGLVLSLVATIALSVLFLTNGLNAIDGLGEAIIVFVPTVLAVMLFMAPPTNCSISLEGRNFWILKTAPLSMPKIFNAKLLASLTFYLPVGVVSGVIIPVSLGASLFTSIEFFFISVSISVLAVCLGLLINILFPMMNWDNESKPIKQGASLLVTMVLGFLLAGLFGVGAYFIKVKPEILFGIILFVLMALTLSVYLLIIKKGSAILDKKIG